MSFILLDQIAGAFYKVFGGNLFLVLIIVGVLAVLLLSIRAGRTVFLIILTPMIVTFFVFGTTKFFSGMGANNLWVPVTLFLALGFVVATIFWNIIQ